MGSGIFEAGLYSIRDTKKWLLWIAVFGVVGYFLLERPSYIPPETGLVIQEYEDPYHANLIRVD